MLSMPVLMSYPCWEIFVLFVMLDYRSVISRCIPKRFVDVGLVSCGPRFYIECHVDQSCLSDVTVAVLS